MAPRLLLAGAAAALVVTGSQAFAPGRSLTPFVRPAAARSCVRCRLGVSMVMEEQEATMVLGDSSSSWADQHHVASDSSSSGGSGEQWSPMDDGTVMGITLDVEGDAPAAAAGGGAALVKGERKLDAFVNLLVVGVLVGGAAWKLATVDADLCRGWTTAEIIMRAPVDNLWAYEGSVAENAVLTKALTSCAAYGIGDFLAQCLRGETLETIDLKRSARSALAGLVVHGPLCHQWIEWMEVHLSFDNAWWNFLPKVIADQTAYSVILNALYTSFVIGLSGEKSPSEIWEYVRSTSWPAITSSWRFWPLIHCLSFSNVIPKDFKLLFIDFMEIIWVTILSQVANKDAEKEGAEGGGDGAAVH